MLTELSPSEFRPMRECVSLIFRHPPRISEHPNKLEARVCRRALQIMDYAGDYVGITEGWSRSRNPELRNLWSIPKITKVIFT